jgi:hypothetical protein
MWNWITAQGGVGGEAIVWLIIAFLWVVAQLVNRFKEQALAKRRRENPDEDLSEEEQASTFEQEMRRFLETIGAEPLVEEIEERKRPEPPPPPRRARRVEPIQETVAPPPPPPVRPQPVRVMPPLEKTAISIDEMDTRIDESVLDTEKAYALIERKNKDNLNAFVDPRTLLVNLNYLRMNVPIIPVSGLASTSENRPRPDLIGHRNLRLALTTQIILSNPLAMGEDKSNYTKRMI